MPRSQMKSRRGLSSGRRSNWLFRRCRRTKENYIPSGDNTGPTADEIDRLVDIGDNEVGDEKACSGMSS
jgi:hypothetical protein